MVLYGASGHAKVIIDILEANGVKIEYIVDDNTNITELLGYEVRRNLDGGKDVIISIGSSDVRRKLVNLLNVRKYLSCSHPTAVVSPRACVGEGTVIMQGAIVQSSALVGNHCIINTGASVDHDCKIGDFVHIAPHATVLGGVEIGDGTWIGAGSVIKQCIKIGTNCMIGAGAVVLNDVPDGMTVVGVPAKELI